MTGRVEDSLALHTGQARLSDAPSGVQARISSPAMNISGSATSATAGAARRAERGGPGHPADAGLSPPSEVVATVEQGRHKRPRPRAFRFSSRVRSPASDEGQTRHGQTAHPKRLWPRPARSQRQLRAGELIRHALVEVMREQEIHDEALRRRLRHGDRGPAQRPTSSTRPAFVEPLGAGVDAARVGGP
jgi:hypothetical protein